MVAKVAIQDQGGQRDHAGDEGQQGLNHGVEPPQLWRERDVGCGRVRVARRTPKAMWCPWRFGLLGLRCGLAGGLFRCATHDLVDAQWKRTPCLHTHERQREAGQPGDRLASQAREAALQTMSGRAGFGHHDFIARQQGDLLRAVHMRTEEDPQPHRPGNHRGGKALHGAIAAPCAGPAGQTQQGEASGDDQQGGYDPAQLAEGRRRYRGSEALEKRDTIDHRWAPLLWYVRCRLGQRNSTRQRTTSPHFWRRYCSAQQLIERQIRRDIQYRLILRQNIIRLFTPRQPAV